MRRKLSLIAALAGVLVLAAPAAAITNGVPDANEHPYVAELLFYVPDAEDSRFDDPGGWFSCTGTLMSSTVLVTAGHCTFGIGIDGASTTHDGEDTTAAEGGVGGTDVWVNFNEVPDFSIFPPSDSYPRDGNPQRYIDRVTALNADPAWHRGTATPHPLYDDTGNAFLEHDAGVVVFGTPVTMPKYGKLAGLDYLDRYQSAPRNAQRFETVGYGLERVQGKKEFGGDTRMKSATEAGQPGRQAARHLHRPVERELHGRDLLRRFGRTDVRQHELEPRRRRDVVGPEPQLRRQGRRLSPRPAGRPGLPRRLRDHPLAGGAADAAGPRSRSPISSSARPA